mgnify:CR=1 FL=1
MKNIKITVFTSTRAEYGLLYWLMNDINEIDPLDKYRNILKTIAKEGTAPFVAGSAFGVGGYIANLGDLFGFGDINLGPVGIIFTYFAIIVVINAYNMVDGIENVIVSLYAKGMSNRVIIDLISHTYGVEYYSSQVSIITNQLLEDIRDWQQRPLQDQYAVVWIDAIHYKIRQDGKVISKACMIVLGIDMEGKQDILSMAIVEQESASAWSGILDDLKSRGVKDILILCSDNLTGLTKAVQAIFPQSIHQICVVHQIRNSLRYVSYKDRKAIIKDIKGIYQASNLEMAEQGFEKFKQNWEAKYPMAIKSWENNWENLTAFLEYPKEIRKLIYTTNIIESFNASLRKYTKNKRVFSTDDAALKSIYLAAQQIRKKWHKARFRWPQIYNQLYIHFENRIL